jgi:hypothetical protein
LFVSIFYNHNKRKLNFLSLGEMENSMKNKKNMKRVVSGVVAGLALLKFFSVCS